MDTGVPNGKTEIDITLGKYDHATIDGNQLKWNEKNKFNYTVLRITKREDIIVDDSSLNYTIEYGWIRPSKFSSLSRFSTQITYVRCARIELEYTTLQDVENTMHTVVYARGFHYFIDTKTTCSRTLGKSSDCNKDTTSEDEMLKNQIVNYKELIQKQQQQEEYQEANKRNKFATNTQGGRRTRGRRTRGRKTRGRKTRSRV